MPETEHPPETCLEQRPMRDAAEQVYQWRFRAARDAGLSILASHVFAGSDVDIGDHHGLRALANGHCPPRLLARIVRPL